MDCSSKEKETLSVTLGLVSLEGRSFLVPLRIGLNIIIIMWRQSLLLRRVTPNIHKIQNSGKRSIVANRAILVDFGGAIVMKNSGRTMRWQNV